MLGDARMSDEEEDGSTIIGAAGGTKINAVADVMIIGAEDTITIGAVEEEAGTIVAMAEGAIIAEADEILTGVAAGEEEEVFDNKPIGAKQPRNLPF